MKDIIKLVLNTCLTGASMYCMWDLEREALALGINGTQFMYVIAGIGLLGGVTLAPILDYFKARGGSDDGT